MTWIVEAIASGEHEQVESHDGGADEEYYSVALGRFPSALGCKSVDEGARVEQASENQAEQCRFAARDRQECGKRGCRKNRDHVARYDSEREPAPRLWLAAGRFWLRGLEFG